MFNSRYFLRKRFKSRIKSKRKNIVTIISLIALCYISTLFDEEQPVTSEQGFVNIPQNIKPTHEIRKDNLLSQVINSVKNLQEAHIGDYEFNSKEENGDKCKEKENHGSSSIYCQRSIGNKYEHAQYHILLIRNGLETSITNKNFMPTEFDSIHHEKTTERNNSLPSLQTEFDSNHFEEKTERIDLLPSFTLRHVKKMNIEFKNYQRRQISTSYTNRIRVPTNVENKMTDRLISILNYIFNKIKKIAMYECLWNEYETRIIDKCKSHTHLYSFYTDHSTGNHSNIYLAKSPGNAIQPSNWIIPISIILMYSWGQTASTSSARLATAARALIPLEHINKLKFMYAFNTVSQPVLFEVYRSVKLFPDSKNIKEFLIQDCGWTEREFKKKFDNIQRQMIESSNPSGIYYDISLLVRCLRVLSEVHEPDSVSQSKWMNQLELEGQCKMLKDLRNDEFHTIMGKTNRELYDKMKDIERLLLDILSSLQKRFPSQMKTINDLEENVSEQISNILMNPLSLPDDAPQSDLQTLLNQLRLSNTKASSRRVTAIASLGTAIDSDHYNMNNKIRGYAYIFAHQEFVIKRLKPRKCAEYDADQCKNTFEKLGFQTEVFMDKDKREFQQILSEIAATDHSQCDAAVIVFMSHGSRKDNIEYLCLRDSRVPTEMLTEALSDYVCPSLIGKPKLFFIQACRGGDKDAGVSLQAVNQPLLDKDIHDDKQEGDSDTDTDDDQDDGIDDDSDEDTDYETDDDDDDNDTKICSFPKFADTLIMWASYQGKKAYKMGTKGSGIRGSVFIHFLCKVLSEDHIRHNLSTMVETIIRKVAIHWESRSGEDSPRYQSKQLPTVQSTVMRTLMFTPKTEKSME